MKFEQLYFYFLLLMVSLWIPFPVVSSPCIALFGLLVIYGAITRKLVFKLNWILVGFFALYLIYMLYCLPSKHMNQSMKYLEYKLSFLVLPLLFSFKPNVEVDRRKILLSFVAACLGLSIFYVLQASINYVKTGDLGYFQSSAFATNHHPSYVAAFLSFAIFILIDFYRSESRQIKKIVYLCIIAFFTLLHFPLTSLAGLLLLLGLYAWLILSWAWQKMSKWLFISMFGVGLFGMQLIFMIQPSLKQNLSYTSELVEHYLSSPSDFVKEHPKDMSGNQARLVIWTITGQIIATHPFGIGLGNLEDEMQNRLAQLKQKELIEKNYNPHNQFLQLTAEIGIVGLCLFVAIFVAIGQFAWKRKDFLLMFLLISLVVNSLFESMLQRQSGIVFYVLMFSSFVTVLRIPKSHES